MTFSVKEKQILLAGFLSLVLLKIVFLVIYGPMHLPDSSGYTVFADRILNEQAWRTQLDLFDYWYPPTGFRAIGYPAFLAVMKGISAQSYDWLAVIFQMGLSLFVSGLMYKLARQMGLTVGWSSFSALAHALGLGLLTDQCILTDSLNANLLIIATYLIAMSILRQQAPSLLRVMAIGGLIALACLIREAGFQLQYLYWILLAWWVFSTFSKWSLRIGFFVACLVPIILASSGYKVWNEARTGQSFITTAGQTSMFIPAINLQKRGINAFANDPLLKDMPPYLSPVQTVAPLQNIRIINKHLVEAHQMDAVAISRYAFKKYVDYWMDYPVDMLRVTLSNLQINQLFLTFSPIETMLTFSFWEDEVYPFFDTRDLAYKVREEGRYDLLAAYVARHFFRVIATLVSLSFLIGVPVLFVVKLRSQGWDFFKEHPAVTLTTLFWLLYMGYCSAYALVSMELRYLTPVSPFVALSGLYILQYMQRQKLFENSPI